jgi:hypothetical protein
MRDRWDTITSCDLEVGRDDKGTVVVLVDGHVPGLAVMLTPRQATDIAERLIQLAADAWQLQHEDYLGGQAGT